MNKIGFNVGNYEGYQDTPEDRLIAQEKLFEELTESIAWSDEMSQLVDKVDNSYYWKGIKYDWCTNIRELHSLSQR